MDDVLFGRLIDAPLDEQGERQAMTIAARLAKETRLLIAASPRRRTQQTAEAIGAATHVDIAITPELDELDFGSWSGQRFSQLEADPRWQTWNEHRDAAKTPAGDCIVNVQLRVAERLHRLHASHPDRTIVLVTHAEVIRSALLSILNLPASAYTRLAISPASISTVLYDGHDHTIFSMNERSHTE